MGLTAPASTATSKGGRWGGGVDSSSTILAQPVATGGPPASSALVPLPEIPHHTAPSSTVSPVPKSLTSVNVAGFGIGGGPIDITGIKSSFHVGDLPRHANEISLSDLVITTTKSPVENVTHAPVSSVPHPPVPVFTPRESTLLAPAPVPPSSPAASTTATVGHVWHGCQGRLRRKTIVTVPVPFGVAEACRLPGVVTARWGHAAVRLNEPASPLG